MTLMAVLKTLESCIGCTLMQQLVYVSYYSSWICISSGKNKVYVIKCVVSLYFRYVGRLDIEGDTNMENRDTLK